MKKKPQDDFSSDTGDDLDVPEYRRVSTEAAAKAAKNGGADSETPASSQGGAAKQAAANPGAKTEVIAVLTPKKAERADAAQPSRPKDVYDLLNRARPQKIIPGAAKPAAAAAPKPARQADPVVAPAGAWPAPAAEPDTPQSAAAGKPAPTAKVAQSANQTEQTAVLTPQAATTPVATPRAKPAVVVPTAAPTEPATPAAGPSAAETATPTAVATTDPAVSVPAVAPARRGTTDLGMFLLRLVIGGLIAVHGAQVLFQLGGDGGLAPLQNALAGYRGTEYLAIGLAVAAFGGGIFLALGLLTPVAAAVTTVTAAFMTLHFISTTTGTLWPNGADARIEVWALLAAVSFVFIFTGPGRWSLDGARTTVTRPLTSAWIFAVVAVAGAAILWLVVAGSGPLRLY